MDTGHQFRWMRWCHFFSVLFRFTMNRSIELTFLTRTVITIIHFSSFSSWSLIFWLRCGPPKLKCPRPLWSKTCQGDDEFAWNAPPTVWGGGKRVAGAPPAGSKCKMKVVSFFYIMVEHLMLHRTYFWAHMFWKVLCPIRDFTGATVFVRVGQWLRPRLRLRLILMDIK